MTTKTKRVTYHYCDFCKKRAGRVDAMQHHEERCTLNPDRKCGMCLANVAHIAKGQDLKPRKRRDYRKLAAEFSIECIAQGQNNRIEALHWLDQKVHCPACMLAVMRLSKVAHMFTDIFQFKEAMDKWNEEEANATLAGGPWDIDQASIKIRAAISKAEGEPVHKA